MNGTVQAFQLGSSTVITLPKKLGIKPGNKFSVKKSGRKLILQPEKMTREEIHKLVKKLSGGLKLDKHLTPEEMNKILDEEYEDHKIMLPGR